MTSLIFTQHYQGTICSPDVSPSGEKCFGYTCLFSGERYEYMTHTAGCGEARVIPTWWCHSMGHIFLNKAFHTFKRLLWSTHHPTYHFLCYVTMLIFGDSIHRAPAYSSNLSHWEGIQLERCRKIFWAIIKVVLLCYSLENCIRKW